MDEDYDEEATRHVRPSFPFCCCRYIGTGKLFFCSVMSFIGFIFLFVCSVFMYRHSPYLDLGNISDEDYDGMGGSTRGAAYVYLVFLLLCGIQFCLQRKIITHP